MDYRNLIIVAVAFLVSACAVDRAFATESAAPRVDTANGEIIGLTEGENRAFRGIPYAKPPVGDLRWRAPQSLPSWEEPLLATSPDAEEVSQAIIDRSLLPGEAASSAEQLRSIPVARLVAAQNHKYHYLIVDGVTLLEEAIRSMYDIEETDMEDLGVKRLFGDFRYLLAAKHTARQMYRVDQPGYLYFFKYVPATASPWLVFNDEPEVEYDVRQEKLSLLQSIYEHRVSALVQP